MSPLFFRVGCQSFSFIPGSADSWGWGWGCVMQNGGEMRHYNDAMGMKIIIRDY